MCAVETAPAHGYGRSAPPGRQLAEGLVEIGALPVGLPRLVGREEEADAELVALEAPRLADPELLGRLRDERAVREAELADDVDGDAIAVLLEEVERVERLVERLRGELREAHRLGRDPRGPEAIDDAADDLDRRALVDQLVSGSGADRARRSGEERRRSART